MISGDVIVVLEDQPAVVGILLNARDHTTVSGNDSPQKLKRDVRQFYASLLERLLLRTPRRADAIFFLR
jgi:hypothetical protein